jgi:hypothetical protein
MLASLEASQAALTETMQAMLASRPATPRDAADPDAGGSERLAATVSLCDVRLRAQGEAGVTAPADSAPEPAALATPPAKQAKGTRGAPPAAPVTPT